MEQRRRMRAPPLLLATGLSLATAATKKVALNTKTRASSQAQIAAAVTPAACPDTSVCPPQPRTVLAIEGGDAGAALGRARAASGPRQAECPRASGGVRGRAPLCGPGAQRDRRRDQKLPLHGERAAGADDSARQSDTETATAAISCNKGRLALLSLVCVRTSSMGAPKSGFSKDLGAGLADFAIRGLGGPGRGRTDTDGDCPDSLPRSMPDCGGR